MRATPGHRAATRGSRVSDNRFRGAALGSLEHLTDSRLFKRVMETIRILLYTDDPTISQDKFHRGLTDLERFISLKLKGIANVTVTLKNRHFDYLTNQPNVSGATQLTSTFLADYDELWIFGVEQTNTKKGPRNKLEPEEIGALLEWMKTGGVMITGDHSSPIEGKKCRDDHNAFIGLGAAIGREVPRAGKLRVWDGLPTDCVGGDLEQRDNFNTQEGDNPLTLDTTPLQHDKHPQTLRLLPANSPHRLFWWYLDPNTHEIVPINKFPDHMHEGHLIIPSTVGGDWPAQSQQPIPVAQGRDKRFIHQEKYSNVVVAYDGDSVSAVNSGVGRIVADSSFHHYLNINLLDIEARDANRNPVPFSDLDQIAQYYGNLVLWLAPKRIRDQITWGLFFLVASHPDILELKGNDAAVLGSAAHSILENEIGVSNLYRLLAPSEHEKGMRQIDNHLSVVFLEKEIPSEFVIDAEQTLGCVIQKYHDRFEDFGMTGAGWLEQDPALSEVAIAGMREAFESLSDPPADFLLQFRKGAEALDRIREGVNLPTNEDA